MKGMLGNLDVGRVVNIGFCLLCAGVVIFSMFNAGSAIASADERMVAIDIEMSDLSQELKETTSQEPVTEVVVRDAVYSAAEAGASVAELQNAYPNLPAMTHLEEREANASALGEHFSEADQNARTEWYGIRYSQGEGLHWEFVSNYGFDSDKVQVLWTLKDSNGDLYAYTIADYNSFTEKFENVVWQTTMLGNSMMGVS